MMARGQLDDQSYATRTASRHPSRPYPSTSRHGRVQPQTALPGAARSTGVQPMLKQEESQKPKPNGHSARCEQPILCLLMEPPTCAPHVEGTSEPESASSAIQGLTEAAIQILTEVMVIFEIEGRTTTTTTSRERQRPFCDY